MDTKSTVQLIHNERAKVMEHFQRGVYSIEFALGHLSGLLNLASAGDLGGLVEDIKNDLYVLIKDQSSGSDQVRPGCTEPNAIFRLDPTFTALLGNVWFPGKTAAKDKVN
ncbi:hypothetical protein L1N85_19970 [Paenibacillus alkaliterrae]|uniref:hypothetical protein n=1 Tax=Paenibacillus alkaliterrae TaxID=320909 RepID=UPI001F28EA47|nr:hypothetical protein [Paenibacillus alkaliterrae]MCF2940672.1 hypothetical protein [Paenibacillus alkaliterrae]